MDDQEAAVSNQHSETVRESQEAGAQPGPAGNGIDDGGALDRAEAALSDCAAKYAPLDPFDLAAKTLSGDLRDFMLELVRDLRTPWHKLSESQQTYTAQRVQDRCVQAVGEAVNLIAARDFTAIPVSLEQVAFKPKGIEAKLILSAISHEVRHALVDAQGHPVLIVVADPKVFLGARGPAKIDKQALFDAPPVDPGAPNGEAAGPLFAQMPDQGEGTGEVEGAENPDEPMPDDAPAHVRVEDMPAPRAEGPKAGKPAKANREAHQVGREDGLAGVRDHAARWPAGEYGHADYEIGHHAGHGERDDYLDNARWSGAAAGRAGADKSTNPYASCTAEHDLWLAGWIAPEPGNNGGHEEPVKPLVPLRRGRPRRAGAGA